MLILHLLLWPTIIASGPSPPSAAQKAEVTKLRGELEKALEENEGAPEGVVVAPGWTQQTDHPPAGKSTKVIINHSSLSSAAAIRQEIQSAVARQGQNEKVLQLEAQLKARGSTKDSPAQVVNTNPHRDFLGAVSHEGNRQLEANVVESHSSSQDIDLEQLQRLELSKRRTRDMLILGRIEELLNFSLPANVDRWLTMQANGSVYLVGQQPKGFVVLTDNLVLLETYVHPFPVTALIGLDRWNSKMHVQEGLLVVASQDQLIWLNLKPKLTAFWHWPLSSSLTKLSAFSLEGRDFLAVVDNRTLSIYAYVLETEEFWIAQRVRLPEIISELAILDTGRELFLAVGQWDEVLIYSWNSRGDPLHLRQKVGAPEVIGITAFQMGGRSYLTLGGILPQILVYMQGQFVPRTILGQNFGFVELFLPIPIRSYRDNLLLLVQHRVVFNPHSLIVLEVLIWNGESFEPGLPPPCGTTYGVGCMLDQDRATGISGAALLRRIDKPPILLVPKNNAPSGIFQLETQLLARNSEAQDVLEIKQFMQNWVHEQEELIKLGEELVMEEEHDFYYHEEVFTPLVVSQGGTVEELFVNEDRWTGADASLDMHKMLHHIVQLHEKLISKRSKRQPEELFNFLYVELEVEAIVCEDLILERLNHAPFYIQNASLESPLVTLNVKYLEQLKPTKSEVVSIEGSKCQGALQRAGDLDSNFINGIEWDKMYEALVWRHQPLKLSQLIINGPVIFEDILHVSLLNDLSFPGDFLWSQGNETSVVKAPKEFTQTLSANAVDTSGSINGVNPQNVITLNDSQDCPGWVTFSHLEVSEELEHLNQNAQGRHFEEAPLNPTLMEAHAINAACHFDQLFVRGSLRLFEKLDNESFESLLGDLVQRTSDSGQELQISGTKRVNQLLLPVDAYVRDNQLSRIPLNDFVTKHAAQSFWNTTQLGGYVYFHRLDIAKSSSYDGVHIDELLSENLRLDVSSPLISPLTQLRFVANSPSYTHLHVDSSLNEVVLLSGYQLLHGALYLSRANFSRLKAGRAQLNHNVVGKGILNGKDLGNLLKAHPYTWSGEVHVQELFLPQGVQTNQLQGIKDTFLLDFLQQLDELPLLILQGRLQVERIAVSGSVQVTKSLNKQDFHELQRQVVWLDRPSELRTRWNLRHPPQFQKNLQVLGSFNERLLPELLDDIVLRSDGKEIPIEGTKSFLSPVYVGELQLVALNGVPFERIVSKVNPFNLTGNVRIDGRLFAKDLQLNGHVNGNTEFITQLEELLRWDPTTKRLMHRGIVDLSGKVLRNLVVEGHLENYNFEPLQELFDQVIFKKQLGIHLQGHKTFQGRVRIENGAFIDNLNGLDLEQLLKMIIFNNLQEEVTIKTPVRFAAAFKMNNLQADRLVLSGELLNGCNVSQWLRDTIRVDRDIREPNVAFAKGSLDGNVFEVEELNHLHLSRVVTRNTEQYLDGFLKADDLYLDGQLMARANVNSQNLSEEYSNTLMNHAIKEQRVKTPLFVSKIIVSGFLQVTSPVNGLNLSDIAMLGEDPVHLQSPLYFATLQAPYLKADQNLNGFDFKDWYERSLWARGREQQEISGSWRVKKLTVKQPDELRPRRQTARENYQDMCDDLSRTRFPYKIVKLRKSFSLKQEKDQENIRRIFVLEATEQTSYLLINENGCWTRVHRWNGTSFDRSEGLRSGPVDEVTALRVGNKSSSQKFVFMTSYKLTDYKNGDSWNCSGIKPIFITSQLKKANNTEQINTENDRKFDEQFKNQQLSNASYEQAIKYLKDTIVGSQLGSKWQEQKQELNRLDLARMRRRLLDTLQFRLQAEVNITQLSIPESDLFDEHLVEDFLELLQQLRSLGRRLNTEALPLPDTPARVLATRSAQLIWATLQDLRKISSGNDTGFQELALEETITDVLAMANDNNRPGDDAKLHAVIQRLRNLKEVLHQQENAQEERAESSSDKGKQLVPISKFDWEAGQTIQLIVGPTNRTWFLLARLTVLTATDDPIPPSTAPLAHIQVYHVNGSIFQSLAAERGAQHLTALRIRDETLLAFMDGCCRLRVLIYRGVRGFVNFAHFRSSRAADGNEEVLQLLFLRLPLNRPPGAMYSLAVVHSRHITFYKFVITGLLEPWLKCPDFLK
ncbi:uncharacterized protein LOC108118540 [Drosophila eugracilis]|uniref:uncharacterized protein LOC108118540 n=1 Tax=Drosophila eugracilis TaxID=29029 RepID=UPI0007E66081|nr:uncharacterized protein LOC108118540 [Drosophila eugracilis]